MFYYCGSLLSTQKSRIKKRTTMTKKSIDNKDLVTLQNCNVKETIKGATKRTR